MEISCQTNSHNYAELAHAACLKFATPAGQESGESNYLTIASLLSEQRSRPIVRGYNWVRLKLTMMRRPKTTKRKSRSGARKKARSVVSAQIRSDQESEDFAAGDKIVRLTNLRKIFWPELGITKRDLLQFYIDLRL
jgi:hypothetical protein